MGWLTLVVNSARSGTYKPPGTPGGLFLINFFEVGRSILDAQIKGYGGRKFCFLPACCHSRWEVQLSYCYGIPLLLLEPAFLGFLCRLSRNCPSGLQC